MFYHYDIRRINNEDILYLYIDIKYEFSNDFDINDNDDLAKRTVNFIKSNNIHFYGNKVFLVIDGVVVKSLQIKDNKHVINNSDYSYDKYMVNIQLIDKSICEITLREYILSLLLSKYLDYITDEVYKAITILYNSYAYKMMEENNYIYSDNSYVLFKPLSYYKNIYIDYDIIIDRLNKIINEVDGYYLSYNGDYVLPFIHYSNNGKTLGNKKYPYLSSVVSIWDMLSPYYVELNTFSYEKLSEKIGEVVNYHLKIKSVIKNNHKTIIINGRIYQIEEFKTLLNLKSTDMYFIINKSSFQVITRGCGSFYGLSLFGACEIAKNGAKYYHILKYYFPKTNILKKVKELP